MTKYNFKLNAEEKKFLEEVIVTYIKDALKSGFKKDEIYSILLENGHNKEIIDLCFDVVEGKIDLWNFDKENDEEKKQNDKTKEINEDFEKIRKFIDTHIKRGFKLEEIKKVLIELGEDEEKINAIIATYEEPKKETERKEKKEENIRERKFEEKTKEDEPFISEEIFFDKWLAEQKAIFFFNLIIWILLNIFFSITIKIAIAVPAIAFMPIILFPLLDTYLKKKYFIAISITLCFLFPTLLFVYGLNPSLEKLFVINAIFFLIYYDIMYAGLAKKILKIKNK
ncbi:MAG: hypothetical protein QXR30_00995 [Candidatus Woesearchaeota archaeon]